jgi:large subunit ribosomal protein L18
MKNKGKTFRRSRIKTRVRAKVKGTTERPRLSVFRSNKQIYAQIIDDQKNHTLAAASSLDKDIASDKASKSETAKMVGKLVAERAKEQNVESVVFDRNGYIYHGRIVSLAEGAREGGLKF